MGAMLLASCGRFDEADGRSAGQQPESPTQAASGAPAELAGIDLANRALARFEGYPPLHGTLIVHAGRYNFVYDIWVREPEFRVDLHVNGESVGSWVSDGTTTNIAEPHVHALPFTVTDPRNPGLWCRSPRFVGTDTLLGRPIFGLSCPFNSGRATYWIDDETGMIVRGKDHATAGPRS